MPALSRTGNRYGGWLMRQATGFLCFPSEKKQPAAEMDILGFTLQYELSFTNILSMPESGGDSSPKPRQR